MQAFATLTRRELATFFLSFTGYIIIASVLGMVGMSFWNLLAALRGDSAPSPVTEVFFNTAYFWTILMLSAPMITMRLFALEKFSGTFETLMTTPISDLQVVMAKFTAALIFYTLTWLPVLGYVLVLRRYAADVTALDWGIMGSTALGIFLIGCLFMAAGCFASALTRSQIIAAMIALGIGVALVLTSYLAQSADAIQTAWAADVLNYVSLFHHMEDFSRGVVDTRAVAFYLSSTFFFLFVTYRIVESRRWK